MLLVRTKLLQLTQPKPQLIDIKPQTLILIAHKDVHTKDAKVKIAPIQTNSPRRRRSAFHSSDYKTPQRVATLFSRQAAACGSPARPELERLFWSRQRFALLICVLRVLRNLFEQGVEANRPYGAAGVPSPEFPQGHDHSIGDEEPAKRGVC